MKASVGRQIADHEYSTLTPIPLPDTWVTGKTLGETKFLTVAADRRGKGTGAALMDAVDRALAARGVHDQFVGALAANAGAIRFYEARGFRAAWLELTRW